MPTFPLVDRFKIMKKALVGRFDDDSLMAAQGMLNGIFPGRTQTPPPRTMAAHLEAYSTMPWVRAIAGRVGSDLAAVEWKLFVERKNGRPVRSKAQRMNRKDRRAYLKKHLHQSRIRKAIGQSKATALMADEVEIEEVTNHLFLDTFDSMNPFLTGTAARKVTAIYLDLVGEAFWLKQRNGLGAPTAFYPIPPYWVQSTPTPSYRFYKLGFKSWRVEIPDTEIFWMADPNPLNPYGRGSGIGQALADELETDEYAAKAIKAVFYNNMRPDFVVMPKGSDGTRREMQQMESSWRKSIGGIWKHFKAHFATVPIDIHEFQQNLRALQFTQIREQERDIIMQVWGIPPEILGHLANSNKATSQVAETHYQKHVQEPRLEFQRSHYQERLIPEYDENLILDYVSPVDEDIEFEAQVAGRFPHAFTVDETRRLAGHDPLPDGLGNVYAIPQGIRFSEDYSNPEPLNLFPGNGNGSNDKPVDDDELETDAWKTMEAEGFLQHAHGEKFFKGEFYPVLQEVAVCGLAKDFDTAKVLKVAFADDPDDLPGMARLAGRLEPRFRREFLEALERSKSQVDLRELARAAQSGHWTALEQALHLTTLDEDLRALSPLLQESWLLGATYANRELGNLLAGAKFDLVNPHAAMFARRHGGELITNLTEQTKKAIPDIRRLIEASYVQGLPPETLERRLRSSVQTIGLLPRQVKAVQNFMVDLIERGTSEAELEKRVVRYGKAQLRVRGLMIARTEIIRASNEGQQGLWLEAKMQGLLTGEEKRVWLATLDESLDSEICEPLMDRTASLGEPFVHPVSGATYMNPPTHPNCRCATGLQRGES